MNLPLGDHTGFDDTESTSRTAAPPSTGILKSRTPAPSFAATAIHLPSGAQDGEPLTSSDSVSARAPAPLADMHQSVDRPARRTGTHIRRPSGDNATAPTTAPSPAFQTSMVSDPETRHTPSAPPRDAR